MFCPNCGSQVADHAAFCGTCGNRLERIPDPEPTPVKKKKSILPVILALVLVAAVVVAGVWFIGRSGDQNGGSGTSQAAGNKEDNPVRIFGSKRKQTLYLMESHSFANYSDYATYAFERDFIYDDQGVLLGYEYSMNHDYTDEDEYDTHITYEYEYEYDEDGLLIAGELEYEQQERQTITAEYEYNEDGVLECIFLTDPAEDEEYEVECNENGWVESFHLGRSHSFEYDEEGNLEAKIMEYSDVDRYVYTYENGQTSGMKQYSNNEVTFGYEYEYNEYGHTIEYKQVNGSECTIDYTYDEDGRILEFMLTEEFGDSETNEIIGEFEWDGTGEAEITFDGDNISCFGLNADLIIELEYDEHGNLLSMNWYEDDVLCAEYAYTYKEVTVAGDYREVDINNPIWLTFFQ